LGWSDTSFVPVRGTNADEQPAESKAVRRARETNSADLAEAVLRSNASRPNRIRGSVRRNARLDSCRFVADASSTVALSKSSSLLHSATVTTSFSVFHARVKAL
jgi:hypothetical protein